MRTGVGLGRGAPGEGGGGWSNRRGGIWNEKAVLWVKAGSLMESVTQQRVGWWGELPAGAESDPRDESSRFGHSSEPQEDTAGDRLTEAQVP